MRSMPEKAPSIPDYSTINRRVNKHVSLDVTSEEVYDGSRLKELVDNALENNTLKRVIEDGAYDSNENFQYLLDKNIDLHKRDQ
jgi:hypothetical protein